MSNIMATQIVETPNHLQSDSKKIEAAHRALPKLAHVFGKLAVMATDAARGSEDLNVDDREKLAEIGKAFLDFYQIGILTHATIETALKGDDKPHTTAKAALVEIPRPADIVKPDMPKVKPVARKKKADEEKSLPPRNGRYYERILLADEIPPIELEEGIDPIDIHITSDDTITMDGKEIKLTGARLFVFNAFLKLRDKDTITASDIRALGFRSDASSLSVAISRIMELLRVEDDSGYRELITRHGETRGSFYTINPAAISTDVVREGSTVTVDFGDGDGTETIQMPYKNGVRNSGSSATTIPVGSPLLEKLSGAKLGQTIGYKGLDGKLVELKILAIE